MSRSVQYDSQFVHYVDLNEEQNNAPATFSYIAAPSYETPAFPLTNVAAPAAPAPLAVATPVAQERCRRQCRSRCRRNRHLRLPAMMLVVAIVLGCVSLTHHNWYTVVQSTPGGTIPGPADQPVNTIISTTVNGGLFKTCRSTLTRGIGMDDLVDSQCFKGCQGRRCKTTGRLAIAAVVLSAVAFIATMLTRCGCFGASRKVWIAPLFALAAVGLSIAVIVLSVKAGRDHHRHHEQDQQAEDGASDIIMVPSPVTSFHAPGCSFWTFALSLMSSVYAALALLGHACRTRCKKWRREREARLRAAQVYSS